MDIDSVVIEVTRRCNMECSHCLRGDAQKQDIKNEYIETLFQKVDTIFSLTVSGGEPSLVPQKIIDIVTLAKKYNVQIGNFYVATNAKKVTNKFLFALISLYSYCYENEYSLVSWSNDIYHEEMEEEQIKKLRALSFASARNSDDQKNYYLINQGRAKGIGQRHLGKEYFEIDGDFIVEGTIYLNCNGDIIAGCDYSYEEQEENAICNVKDFSIETVSLYQLNDAYVNA